MEYNAQQEAVLSTLGREDGTAGKAIVDLIATLSNTHQELLTAFNEHEKNVTNLTSTLANKADKSEVADINRRLHLAAQALGGAVTAHDVAAQAINSGSASAQTVNDAGTATESAATTVAECSERITALTARVKSLEDWRTNITPDLDWVRLQRRQQEHDAPQVPLFKQPPAPEPVVEEHAAPQPAHPPTRMQPTVEQHLAEREVVRTHFIDRTVDIRHWSGVQWACALLLGVIFLLWLGPIFSEWARSEMQGHAWDWVTNVMRFLGWIIAAAIGFCLGGVVGTLIDNAVNSRTSAARREEHEQHAQHVVHDDRHAHRAQHVAHDDEHHNVVHANDVTRVR